jgi:hypothetical protein
MYPITNKKHQMAINYTKIFHSKAFKNTTKFGFFGMQISGNPDCYHNRFFKDRVAVQVLQNLLSLWNLNNTYIPRNCFPRELPQNFLDYENSYRAAISLI